MVTASNEYYMLAVTKSLYHSDENSHDFLDLSDKDYGTVEVGKIANLLLLDNNPLTSVESWNSIDTIILHGNPIARESLMVNK